MSNGMKLVGFWCWR